MRCFDLGKYNKSFIEKHVGSARPQKKIVKSLLDTMRDGNEYQSLIGVVLRGNRGMMVVDYGIFTCP
jgi:hypothetical protein